ncbi:MAG: tRNA (adenosine(37)-N6)-threonylcarbamoyltransferase complex ATPase subunit type 1 TsaE [bacterium]|nr:tRNA (adenosine(37)-N6)-threonylcarbamoyltransferase complex ATPase subunit type 1 TsaE [bacterium]
MKVLLNELSTIVKKVLAALPQGGTRASIITLQGELGAGKTTFVQALAKELGVIDIVQSPTYVLMKKYQISHPRFKTLIHIDAYRLNNAQEFAALEPEQFLNDPNNLVCIEWPERVEGALPKPDLTIKFSSEGASEAERFIEVEK